MTGHQSPIAFLRGWIAPGDVNGFFALAVDNLALLAGMSAILVGIFHLPAGLVAGRMLPGSAIGVLAGDLAYSVLAMRLARREGRGDVCAMPLGIDTPSMFGLCFGVIGPAWLLTRDADRTLAIGSGVVLIMGLAKTAAAFFGDWVRRTLPRSAMLAALSAVAIALIAFFSMQKIIDNPVAGLVALGVVLSSLIGGRRLPGRLPVMLAAITLGILADWAVRLLAGGPAGAPNADAATMPWQWHLPWPSLLAWQGLPAALPYLPLAIPFAIATVVGGIDNTESAAVAGDRYATRDILLVEGLATMLAAVCGGVLQNTPYIGHPAYKRMGARAGYTVATGLFIGLGTMCGLTGMLIALLPEAVLAPILVFVGLELTSQSFRETGREHLTAVAIAFIPAMAEMALIQCNGLLGALHLTPEALPAPQQEGYQALTVLANGFIVTGMLWSALLIDIIDRRRGRALALCVMAAALSLFGVIHSPFADGHLFLPGTSLPRATIQLAAAYLLLGGVIWGLDRYDARPAGQAPDSRR